MKFELLSLRAVNCGPLRDIRLDFSNGQSHARPVTLLAGANGSGKTTVLELIVALADMIHPIYSSQFYDGKVEYIGQRAEYSECMQILRRTQYAQMDLLLDGEATSIYLGEQPGDAQLAENYFGRESLERSLPDVDRIKGEPIRRLRRLLHRQQDAELDQLRTTLGASVSTQARQTPAGSVLFFPAIRFLGHTEGSQIVREETLYRWVYRYDNKPDFSGSLSSYLVWLEYAETERFEQVRGFLNKLYPSAKEFAVNRRRLKAVVKLLDGSTHDVDQLSSGEQNLLIVLLELYRRLLPGSIVLIDEVENSLHPAFQHRMAQGLLQLQQEVPFQLIVTSHADDIYEVFGAGATLVLPASRFATRQREPIPAA